MFDQMLKMLPQNTMAQDAFRANANARQYAPWMAAGAPPNPMQGMTFGAAGGSPMGALGALSQGGGLPMGNALMPQTPRPPDPAEQARQKQRMLYEYLVAMMRGQGQPMPNLSMDDLMEMAKGMGR